MQKEKKTNILFENIYDIRLVSSDMIFYCIGKNDTITENKISFTGIDNKKFVDSFWKVWAVFLIDLVQCTLDKTLAVVSNELKVYKEDYLHRIFNLEATRELYLLKGEESIRKIIKFMTSKMVVRDYLPLAIFDCGLRIFFYQTYFIIECFANKIGRELINYEYVKGLFYVKGYLVIISQGINQPEKMMRISRCECSQVKSLFNIFTSVLGYTESDCSEQCFRQKFNKYYLELLEINKEDLNLEQQMKRALSIEDRFSIRYFEKPTKRHLISMVTDKGKVLYSDGKDRTSKFEPIKLAKLFGLTTGKPGFIWVNRNGKVISEGDVDKGITTNWNNIVAISSDALLGLSNDGKVYTRYGKPLNTKIDVNEVVRFYETYNGFVVLKKNGSIDSDSTGGFIPIIQKWKNIRNFSYSTYHVVGLKVDGTVVATGRNNHGQCNVGDWNNIISVTAEDELTVGVKKDGTIIWAGSPYLRIATERTDIAIDVSKELNTWKNIICVTSGPGLILGVDNTGKILITPPQNNQNISNWKLDIPDIILEETLSAEDRFLSKDNASNIISPQDEEKGRDLTAFMIKQYNYAVESDTVAFSRYILKALTGNVGEYFGELVTKNYNYSNLPDLFKSAMVFSCSKQVILTDQALILYGDKEVIGLPFARGLLELLPVYLITETTNYNHWDQKTLMYHWKDNKKTDI